MRIYALLFILALVACAPIPQPVQDAQGKQGLLKQEPQVLTKEEVVTPPQELPPKTEETGTEPEAAPQEPEIAPYTTLGCEQLITSTQFASACGKSPDDFVVTYKIGTRNCFVNIRDKLNERLTAGITLTGYKDGVAAMTEFERRLKVFNVGADKSAGERAYTFKKLDRETIHFVRDEFLVEVGADTRLCSKEGILETAREVDQYITS